MMLWILFLFMIALVAAILLAPLLLISKSRFSLVLGAPHRQPRRLSGDAQHVLAFIIIMVVALGSIGLYGELGNPSLPARPYGSRQSDPDFIMAVAADNLAHALAEKPDVDGYGHLAALYFTERQYGKSADALERIIAMNGGNAETWSELGQTLTSQNDGIVVPRARGAFGMALRFDPTEARARYFLGLNEAQHRRAKSAIAIWKDLEATSLPTSPWTALVKKRIEMEAAATHQNADVIAPKPPDLDGINTSPLTSSMDDSQLQEKPDAVALMATASKLQKQMIARMVDSLALKMKDNPNDLAGWEKLARSYRVLGEADKAEDADRHSAALRANESSAGKPQAGP